MCLKRVVAERLNVSMVVLQTEDLLIEEFPNYKDIISTKEEIEKI